MGLLIHAFIFIDFNCSFVVPQEIKIDEILQIYIQKTRLLPECSQYTPTSRNNRIWAYCCSTYIYFDGYYYSSESKTFEISRQPIIRKTLHIQIFIIQFKISEEGRNSYTMGGEGGITISYFHVVAIICRIKSFSVATKFGFQQLLIELAYWNY